MHFWIDKRSQTCGFSGRHRVPASLSAGCQRRRRRARSKPMVTPVHRFQPVECLGVAQQNARRAQQQHHRQLHNYVPNSLSTGNRPVPNIRSSSAHSAELDSGVFLDIPLDGPSGSTGTAEHNHRTQQHLLPFGRLKCGMWASFALATIFVAGAKVYYDHEGRGMEVLVFCALLVVFLLSICTVLLCRSQTTREILSAAVSLQATRSSSAPSQSSVPVQTTPNTNNEEVDLQLPIIREIHFHVEESTPSPVEAPPPPYHIAILLPQQDVNSIEHVSAEAPPPSYDKAVG